jgi:hypothetical protein
MYIGKGQVFYDETNNLRNVKQGMKGNKKLDRKKDLSCLILELGCILLPTPPGRTKMRGQEGKS